MTEPGNYPRGVDTRDPFPRRTATPVGLMPWIAEVGKTYTINLVKGKDTVVASTTLTMK